MRQGEVVMGFGTVRLELDRPFEMRHRLGGALQPLQGDAEIVVSVEKFRLAFDQSLDQRERLVEGAALEVKHTQSMERGGVIGILREQGLVVARLVHAALVSWRRALRDR